VKTTCGEYGESYVEAGGEYSPLALLIANEDAAVI
jgi:hypothetical protein